MISDITACFSWPCPDLKFQLKLCEKFWTLVRLGASFTFDHRPQIWTLVLYLAWILKVGLIGSRILTLEFDWSVHRLIFKCLIVPIGLGFESLLRKLIWFSFPLASLLCFELGTGSSSSTRCWTSERWKGRSNEKRCQSSSPGTGSRWPTRWTGSASRLEACDGEDKLKWSKEWRLSGTCGGLLPQPAKSVIPQFASSGGPETITFEDTGASLEVSNSVKRDPFLIELFQGLRY